MSENRLKLLINKFHEKTISGIEHQELLTLLAKVENEKIAKTFLKDSWNKFKTTEQQLVEIEPSKAIKNIFEKNDTPNKDNFYKYLKYAAAACILVFLSAQLFFSKTKSLPIETPTVRTLKDLTPGKNLATITLPNQQKLVISNTSPGIIDENEHLIIRKNKNNEILVEVKENPNTKSKSHLLNTITTPKGGQFTVILPDKSKVYLNAETTLQFPSLFASNKRNVTIEGEAYFEITKDKNKPFFVQTPESTIQVLGTTFNINAYKTESTQNTTLIEGSIKIAKGKTSRLMTPGQQAEISKNNDNINLKEVDLEQVIAWKNGYYLFASQDLKTIMKTLARWYNFEIRYESSFKNVPFTGTISRNQNISEILKIFETTGTVNYKILAEQTSNTERRIIVMN